MEPKLEKAAETLVLCSGPKFTCLIVHFHKNFWFWWQTGIVLEKVYVTSNKKFKNAECVKKHLLNFHKIARKLQKPPIARIAYNKIAGSSPVTV